MTFPYNRTSSFPSFLSSSGLVYYHYNIILLCPFPPPDFILFLFPSPTGPFCSVCPRIRTSFASHEFSSLPHGICRNSTVSSIQPRIFLGYSPWELLTNQIIRGPGCLVGRSSSAPTMNSLRFSSAFARRAFASAPAPPTPLTSAPPLSSSSFSLSSPATRCISSTSLSRQNFARSRVSTSPRRSGVSSLFLTQTRTMALDGKKIKVQNPVVELDGDEVCGV